jgi:hypothetical protein
MRRFEAPAASHTLALPDLEACMTPDHDLKGATTRNQRGAARRRSADHPVLTHFSNASWGEARQDEASPACGVTASTG